MPQDEAVVADAAAAKEALDKQDYARAARLYREICRLHPDSQEAWSDLGVALHLDGRTSEAVNAFRHSIRLHPTTQTTAMLTLDLCRLGQADEAKSLLRPAREYLGDKKILELLAPCYLEYGEPLDAVMAYRTFLESGDGAKDELAVNLARAYFRASHLFLLALEKAPSNAPYVAAVKAAREQQPLSARSAFPQAAKDAPYLRPGMSTEQLSELLPQHGREAAFLYVVGVLAGEWGMQAYVWCEQQFPNSPWIKRLKADMLASEGQTAEAITEFKKLIESSAAIPDLNYKVAMLYRESGAFEEALQYFRRQGAASPHDERVPVGISNCLLRLGRYKELRTHLAPIVSQSQPPEWALLDLANAEDKLGNPEGALRPLVQASKLYPKSPTVHFRLAGVYRKLNRQDLAGKEIKVFYELKQASAKPAGGAESPAEHPRNPEK